MIFTDKINEITSYGDLAAWQPLEGEVEYYNVRAYYRNSIGGRKGTKMRNLNRPWVKLLNDFAGDLVRGLDYYIQVCLIVVQLWTCSIENV